MTDRSCPSCGLGVAPHQTLCPSCRTPVPSEPGPVAPSAEGSGITLSAPPPRRARGEPPAAPVAPHRVAVPAPPSAQRRGPADDTMAFGAEDLTGDATAVAAVPVPAGAAGSAGGWPGAADAGPVGVPGGTAAAVDTRGNVAAGLLALAAAALVAAGVFLPWLEVAGDGVSGWRASADARVLLGLAAGTTVVAALLIGGARALVLRLALVAAGLATAGLGAYEVTSVLGLDPALRADLGAGPLFVASGGLLAVGAGLVTRHRRRR